MTKPQDIIDLIDVGLQTPSPDPTYGEVSPANQETCARCHRPPADESDWCEGCRAYLLGDRDDPREELRAGAWPEYMQGRWHSDCDALTPERLLNLLHGAHEMASFDALQDAAEPFEAPERPVDPVRRRHGHAAICPRHGETRGGTCRRCL